MMQRFSLLATLMLVLSFVTQVAMGTPAQAAAPTYYTDRPTFEGALYSVIIDDYGTPPYPEGFGLYDDDTFSAFFGETDYESTSFPDFNVHLPEGSYCAGCSGSFRLSFQTTSLTIGGLGVYGVGVDVQGLGLTTPYYAYITYGDGTTDDILVPGLGFFGVTAPELIASIHFGLSGGEPDLIGTGYFVIDNLTIGKQYYLYLPFVLR